MKINIYTKIIVSPILIGMCVAVTLGDQLKKLRCRTKTKKYLDHFFINGSFLM